MITLKRAYEPASIHDGVRVLVERLWPRGITKRQLKIDAWLKNVAPSDELRRWFAHDPEKWSLFRDRYGDELDSNRAAWKELASTARRRHVTLIYSARDREHNNAVALKDYLKRQPRGKTKRKDAARANEQAIPIHIRTFEIDLARNDRMSIRRRINRKLQKFANSIERVSVRLQDVNGPRGGVDRACQLKVVLRKLPTVIIKEHDISLDGAIGKALSAAHREVRRSLQRRRQKPKVLLTRLRSRKASS